LEGGLPSEAVPSTPQKHHHIGVSEKHHHSIGEFLRKNTGDPAIQVGNMAKIMTFDNANDWFCRAFCPS
jgi:hypothetical protein